MFILDILDILIQKKLSATLNFIGSRQLITGNRCESNPFILEDLWKVCLGDTLLLTPNLCWKFIQTDILC